MKVKHIVIDKKYFFIVSFVEKICVSVRWVTLWVRPPPLWINMCVHSLGCIVGASPPCENMCVRLLGYIVGASPLCLSVQLVILWVRPPLVCVLSLEDNLHWILACCLLYFATFLWQIFEVKNAAKRSKQHARIQRRVSSTEGRLSPKVVFHWCMMLDAWCNTLVDLIFA